MFTRSTKTIIAALVWLVLVGFITVSIPHPLDETDAINEQWVKEVTAGGAGMSIGTYVLAEFNVRIPVMPGHDSGGSRAGIPAHAGPV